MNTCRARRGMAAFSAPLDQVACFRHCIAMDYASGAGMNNLIGDSEKKALELFDSMVKSTGAERLRNGIALADLLGNPGEFAFYFSCSEDQRLIRCFHLLRVFRENIELLVHKTWAEGLAERSRESLLEELNLFVQEFREGRMVSAFRSFVTIARHIPSLLFGPLGKAPDFLEYAFRIDPKFGLFFWYVEEIERQLRNLDELPEHRELFELETLIGAFVLSCF